MSKASGVHACSPSLEEMNRATQAEDVTVADVPSLSEVLDTVQSFCTANWPALHPTRLTIRFLTGPSFSVPMLGIGPRQATPVAFDNGRADRGERLELDECTADILATLRAVGRPLSKTRLLEEMAARQRNGACGEYSEATVCRRLAALMKDGTLENPPEARPRGYRLSE